MKIRPGRLLWAVLLSLTALPYFASAEKGSAEPQWRSEKGSYNIRYSSSLQPIETNRIHAWVLHVKTNSGEPVEGAEITIVGGMPAHDHGLPTRPRVTGYLGEGNYRVEGVRFHMAGVWEIAITIKVNDRIDVVIIPLQL